MLHSTAHLLSSQISRTFRASIRFVSDYLYQSLLIHPVCVDILQGESWYSIGNVSWSCRHQCLVLLDKVQEHEPTFEDLDSARTLVAMKYALTYKIAGLKIGLERHM